MEISLPGQNDAIRERAPQTPALGAQGIELVGQLRIGLPADNTENEVLLGRRGDGGVRPAGKHRIEDGDGEENEDGKKSEAKSRVHGRRWFRRVSQRARRVGG